MKDTGFSGFTDMQRERYARHFVLREIGPEGQERLHRAHVLIVGAGGLGSPAAMYLAAAGVGSIGIADGDTVSLSNLQRQILHAASPLGTPKALSARSALEKINPDVEVTAYPVRLTPENLPDILPKYDFVLDCTDGFASKFLINDACVLFGKPYCHAGALRFEGQVMTYVPGKGPCLRCLLGDVPPRKDAPTCAEVGVLGALTGVIGALQALEAVKYLTGCGELLIGKIFSFDGLTMRSHLTEVPQRSPDCPVCGTHPAIRSLLSRKADYCI